MANPTVSITASVINGDHILTVNLTTSEPSQSGKAFVLSLSDYDGFPDPNQSSSFPATSSYACGWNLGSTNLASLNATFYAVIIIPPGQPLPNQIEWTLEYVSGAPYSDWAVVN